MNIGNTFDAAAIRPECFAPVLSMAAKPLGIAKASIDLLQQFADVIATSVGHLPLLA